MPRKKKGLQNPYKSAIFESTLYKQFEASKNVEISENTGDLDKTNSNVSFNSLNAASDQNSSSKHNRLDDKNTALQIEGAFQQEERHDVEQPLQKYNLETKNCFKLKLPAKKNLLCLKVRIPKTNLLENGFTPSLEDVSANNSQGILYKEESAESSTSIDTTDLKSLLFTKENHGSQSENSIVKEDSFVVDRPIADTEALMDQSEIQNSSKSEVSNMKQEISKECSSPLTVDNLELDNKAFVYASNQGPDSQSVFTNMHKHEDDVFNDKQDLDDIEDIISLSFGSVTSSNESANNENASFLLSSYAGDPDNSCSFEFPVENVDWSSIMPVITYAMSLYVEIPTKPTQKKTQEKIKEARNVNKKDSVKARKDTDQSVFFESTYLYFLKKVCNLTKRECVMYGRDQNKLLMERAAKNKAEVLKLKRHYAVKEDRGVRIFSSIKKEEGPNYIGAAKEEKLESVFLEKISAINPIVLPEYEKDSFEYMVYKYGENLETISKKLNMDIKDVIVIYYLNYYGSEIKIVGPLLEKYVDDEWSITDRILFEENFTKYTTKFSKYMMNKSEEELKIYYKFYLKNYLPVNWSEEERSLFARLIGAYKKDWNDMANYFKSKNANELKVYYSSYFKKLDEEERLKEQELSPGDSQLQVTTHKKRGRKPNLMKAIEKDDGS